jgi:hypothetical protein
MVQADGLNNTSTRWQSLDPALVWVIKRIEMLPPDAERIANSPEMYPKLEWALNRLKGELYAELNKVFVLGAARSWPINKFRIFCGGRYVDLLTLYRPLSAGEPSAQFAVMREFVEDLVKWPDVEFNSNWLKRAFPATAPETSAPVANTKSSVAEPETASPSPVNAITAEATTSPLAVASGLLSRAEAKPAPTSPTEPPETVQETQHAEEPEELVKHKGTPGRKPGVPPKQRAMCAAAENILNNNRRRPKPQGRNRAIAKMLIKQKEFKDYKLATIEDYIRSEVREWEKKNSGK